MSIEIEKKFLLSGLPSGLGEGIVINQGYLSTADPEARIRKMGDVYTFTQKYGEGMARKEKEDNISAGLFAFLWPQTVGKRIEKIRYTLAGQDKLVWEIDNYQGSLTGLFIAELELQSKVAKFNIPFAIQAVLVADVTEDGRYKNKNLAVKGRPKN